MKVYFDCCFLNRPFDDQSQDRIRLEREALGMMLRRVAAGEWTMIGGEALEIEVRRIADRERREAVEELASLASERVSLTAEILDAARALASRGILGLDALHVASAGAAGASILFTVDDRLYKRAHRPPRLEEPRVAMPLLWLETPDEERDT